MKVWTVEEIKELLLNRNDAVIRGILAIYKLQTIDEQQEETTREHNGVGFNAIDAEIMSSFAKQIQRGKQLSEKQMAIAKKKIMKYARQLCKIANKEIVLG